MNLSPNGTTFAGLCAQIPTILAARRQARDAVAVLTQSPPLPPDEPCTWEDWSAYEDLREAHSDAEAQYRKAVGAAEHEVTQLITALLGFGIPPNVWLLTPSRTNMLRLTQERRGEEVTLDYRPAWTLKGTGDGPVSREN